MIWADSTDGFVLNEREREFFLIIANETIIIPLFLIYKLKIIFFFQKMPKLRFIEI